ncbi:pentraxin fusion protein-like [Xyrichtys novacula]|uniref:Pentraxin family member n=1 Tax=Xyrichtys novacula TaxID=13765 RepID=A0AAV1GSM9_XYRNO|nr:pentraxin fusion protein-like [Xyrichtys novacula]
MKPVAVFFLFTISSAFAVTVKPVSTEKYIDKILVFPEPSVNTYAVMTPLKPLNLKAFTLCMRVATELSGYREVILFAYRTKDHDELNVWREKDGRLSLYLRSSSECVKFRVPELGALTTHLCLTWDSKTGATTIFMNGQKSLTKIYRKGHTIEAGGTVVLGQDPDSYLGHFDSYQSFVGEISDVDMWSYVRPDTAMVDMANSRGKNQIVRGNVINWATGNLKLFGNVYALNHLL